MECFFPGAGLRNEQIGVQLRPLPQWLHLSVTPPIACRLLALPHSSSDSEESMKTKHYVEVDGKPFEGIEKEFSYREAAALPGVAGQSAAR